MVGARIEAVTVGPFQEPDQLHASPGRPAAPKPEGTEAPCLVGGPEALLQGPGLAREGEPGRGVLRGEGSEEGLQADGGPGRRGPHGRRGGGGVGRLAGTG
jgi:hypothetical protein